MSYTRQARGEDSLYDTMDLEEGTIERALNPSNLEDTEEGLAPGSMHVDRDPSPELPQALEPLARVTKAIEDGLEHGTDQPWVGHCGAWWHPYDSADLAILHKPEYLNMIRKHVGREPGDRLVISGNAKIEELAKVQSTSYQVIPL